MQRFDVKYDELIELIKDIIGSLNSEYRRMSYTDDDEYEKGFIDGFGEATNMVLNLIEETFLSEYDKLIYG